MVALLWVIVPPRSRILLSEPQQVITSHDHVCVHTRLIDEVEEWVIQQSLIYTREMGANTIVEFFPWAYIESTKGRYDWSQTDKIVKHAQNQGIRIIARMGFVPAWARQDKPDDWQTLNYLPDEAFDNFAEFVALFAQRYAGTIDHLIIWNEPNLAFEWGYRQISPADYVRLLQAVYAPAKAANANVKILAGALAPTLEPIGSANGLNDVIFLEQMYDAGASNYFDILAIHTYGFTESPSAEPAFDELNFRRAELLREVMVANGDSEKSVFITESGWNDHPRWTKSVTPSQRVQYTIDSFRYAEANWDWTEGLCIWVLRYPFPTFSYPDNFTLITTDLQRKPIYYAIQAYANNTITEGALWLEPPTE